MTSKVSRLALALVLAGSVAGASAQTSRVLDDPYEGPLVMDPAKTPPAVRGYSPYAGRGYPTRVLWGDTHHHTANSGDAFAAGNRLTPEQSYRLARGEAPR